MHPELLQSLTAKAFVALPATLHEFQRYSLEKEGWPRIPVIVEEIGSSVQGILVRDVDEDSVEVLDDFEDVEFGLYVKRQVEIVGNSGHTSDAIAYVAGPEALDYLSGVWRPEQFLEQYYYDYRDRIIPDFLSER